MSTVSSVHTLIPREDLREFFHEVNVRFLQKKIRQILGREFRQKILFDRASVVRLMERVFEEKVETIPKMNQRVVMYATNEFRVHQLEVNKRMKWEGGYSLSQRLYDPLYDKGAIDSQKIKLANRLGYPTVGGTTRFYFS